MGLPFAPSPSQIVVGAGLAAARRRLFSSITSSAGALDFECRPTIPTPFISSSNGRPSAAFFVRAHARSHTKTAAVSDSGWATNEGPREPAFYAGVVAQIYDPCLLLRGGAVLSATAAGRAWLTTCVHLFDSFFYYYLLHL
ncbi:hypothetical protein PIB30_033179 [Stylosanthes scabra]|uniref:Uncharacterized protein n=1 Tax=Stylosanthes scabra TaxID=79078 RepID=A0ABU6QBW8_9FABA|nr:hypothetical protein [Stylosanthes scabra]